MNEAKLMTYMDGDDIPDSIPTASPAAPALAPVPKCVDCGGVPKPDLKNIEPRCVPCLKKYLAKYVAKNKPSQVIIDAKREEKRVEMLKNGELCTRCGRGAPDPGHELCFGCERDTAKRVVKRPFGRMPESCMYGYLGDYAKSLGCPLDAAYPAVLAVAAGYFAPEASNVNGNLYVTLVGDKGSGKSVTIKRAYSSWHPPTDMQIIKKYPGSEIGLVQLLGGKKAKDMDETDYIAKPFLLVQDEMRMTFGKMDIKGSALPNALNQLFYEDTFGTASKQGHWECCARLSVLGGVTCDGPDEFAEVYGANTVTGTYDRTLFGIMPEGWEFDFEWQPADNFWRPAGTVLPPAIREMAKEWRKKDWSTRRRLAELAERVAVITASLNHDKEVTEEGMRCALEFMEWQEDIRRVYNPSETDDLDGQAERSIIRALEKYPSWVKWRDVCNRHTLYKAAKSAVRLNRVKRAMVFEGMIEEETELKSDGSKGEKTGRVRLAP